MQAAVFLDRDNTIIHNDGDLGDPAKVRLIQGVASAIASLCGLGYRVVVVTNQGGVARGMYTKYAVEAVHERIREMVRKAANGARIDAFYYCPYHPEGTVEEYRTEHPTRKPQPGMLLEAARDLKLDLNRSWMIGDQMRDVEAGKAAGCRTILIGPDATGPEANEDDAVRPDAVAPSLIEAVRVIAQQRKPEVAGEIARPALGAKRWDAAAVAQLQRQRPAPRREAPAPETEMPGEHEHQSALAAEPAAEPEAQAPPAVSPESLPDDRLPPVPQHPPAPEVEADMRAQADVNADTEVDADAHPGGSDSRTLRLILQELRQQRGTRHDDFSSAQMLALVFQMLAGLCLLGGLWMGAGEENFGLFLRWMGAALIFQGVTISALLFGR